VIFKHVFGTSHVRDRLKHRCETARSVDGRVSCVSSSVEMYLLLVSRMFNRVKKENAMHRSSYSYHGTPYERCTTPVALHLRQSYADWFKTFAWSFYLTLTFSRDKKRDQADSLLEEYLREVERHIRAPLSCLIAPEEKYSGVGMPAGRTHFHLLVGCGPVLAPSTLVNIWRQPNYGGTWVSKHKANDEKLEAGESAYVLPYDRSIDASFYLFKTMGTSDWNWSLRRGHLISPQEPASAARSTQMRRVRLRQSARRYETADSRGVMAYSSSKCRKKSAEERQHANRLKN
jgi:hypothetical protein